MPTNGTLLGCVTYFIMHAKIIYYNTTLTLLILVHHTRDDYIKSNNTVQRDLNEKVTL
jgi:hypothetical protein